MALDGINLLKERVNLRTLLAAIIIAGLGIFLLYINRYPVTTRLGELLFVTGTITLLWELWVKRAFLDEVLAKTQIAQEIRSAGIVKITNFFYRDIDWKSYFSNVKKLDIFFAYGSTWRNSHIQELREVAVREDARIRVVLPDPKVEQIVSELARRFERTPEDVKKSIREAEEFFRSLRPSTTAKGAQIDIQFLPAAPLFTFYRFDNIGILALYSHRGRSAVPTFVCMNGGTLYDFIRKEFDFMISPPAKGEEEKPNE